MTPAERIAVIRTGMDHDICVPTRRELLALLALAEAVPARLASGHNFQCTWHDKEQPYGDAGPCSCGHDALAAAWAALGDE